MRFHKLEICNLNSLAGEHAVDFDLVTAGAGMFLIHGPTGAGKSTILDAICLALFGKTPRLGEAGAKTIAGADEGASDENPVRAMTQGTGHARVSLELSLADAHGNRTYYRAGWSAHRAKRSADGKFQPPRRSLEKQVDGNWVLLVASEQRGDIEAAFNTVLQSLTFTDFQRTILLAQFKFREFLEADIKARTIILERMTDSEHFRYIGRKAAEQKRNAEENVRVARAGLDGLAVLSTDDRAELEGQLAQIRAQLGEVREQISVVERASEFWTRLHDAQLRSEAAGARAADIAAKRKGAEQRLNALTADERVTPARSARTWMREREEVARELRERGETSHRNEDEMAARREEAIRTHELTLARLKDGEDNRAALRPEIDAAAEAWRAATAERQASERASELSQKAANELERERTALAHVEQRWAKEALLKAECETRLADIPAAALLLEAAGAVADLASHVRTLVDATARAEEACAAERQTAEDHAQGRAALFAVVDGRRASTTAASSHARQSEAQLAAATGGMNFDDSVQSADAAREAADEALSRLDSLQRAHQQHTKLEDEVKTLERLSDERARLLEDTRGRMEQLRSNDKQHALILQEERANLRTVDALLAVLKHRDVLRDNEPCPVCGSQEHPWVSFPEQAPRLDEERTRHAVLTERVTAAESAARESALELKDAELAEVKAWTALEEIQRQTLARRTDLAEASAELDARTRDAGSDGFVSGGWIDEALAAAKERRSAAVQRVGTLRQLDSHVREARAAELQAVDAHADAERALKSHDDDAKILKVRLEALDEQARERRRERDHAIGQLRERLIELSVDLPDVAAGAAELAARAARVRNLTDERQRLDDSVRQLEPARASARTAFEQAAANDARARQEAESAAARAATALTAAQARLAGADPEVERQRLDAAVAALSREEAAARDSVATSTTTAAQATTLATVHAEEARAAAEEALRAREQFEESLRALGLASIEELDARTLPEDERKAASLFRELLVREEQEAGALLTATQADLAQVESTRPADEPPDGQARERHSVLSSSLKGLQTAREDLIRSEAVIKERLTDDDVMRAEAAGRTEGLAKAQTDLEHWETLHELIGTNDGERFATVVQALHLREVLGHANESLARFMRRYELEQVVHREMGPLLDFRVVDKDQQGAVRSIRSLSGGESFVVSLALALGLSAVRSSRLRIETLLIDEGFGSLDAGTLAIAHQALESLQGAVGVQIGIISHVDALKEKIPAQIVVEPAGAGVSRIRTSAGPRGSPPAPSSAAPASGSTPAGG